METKNTREKCVICNQETLFDYDDHIETRYGYIEGVGQLCISCYEGNADATDISIPNSFVIQTPNDMQLGEKIRRLFWNKFKRNKK